MRVFVVEHVPTGKFLPPLKSCKPATRRELSETPRVFYRERDARTAATWWASGMSSMDYEEDWETGLRQPIGVQTYPDKNRDIQDLRVCDCSLTILQGMTKRID